MQIPQRGHRVWTAILEGKTSFPLSFFAAKILVVRSRSIAAKDPSRIRALSDELYDLYANNINTPSAKADIANMLR